MTSVSVADWSSVLPYLAVSTGVLYLGLMLAFGTLVIPAAAGNPLPRPHLELVAAKRRPVSYRLTIALDIALQVAIGAFLIALGGATSRAAPIQGAFVSASGLAMVCGFIGAYIRLMGTSELATQYSERAPNDADPVLASYRDLRRLVNALFSAGALIAGVGLVLAASAVWPRSLLPYWVSALLGIAGLVFVSKSVTEIATGKDLEALSLLGAVVLIAGVFSTAATL